VVELKKDEIDTAIKFFRSKNSGEMKLGEAMRLGMVQENPKPVFR